MVTNVKETFNYRSKRRFCLDPNKGERERGGMKNDCCQSGRVGRARQQGSNILGWFPGGQAIRSKLTRRCATHNLLVRHENEARTRKATRFVRVAMERLKTETRRDSPPDMSHACLGLGLGSPSRSLSERITRPGEQLRGPRVVLDGCCRCDLATNHTQDQQSET